MRVLVPLVFACVVGYSWGQTCPPIPCPLIECQKPPGYPCEVVIKPCACCPKVCALELGQPCGSKTQPCQSDLRCAKQKKGKLVAYKKVPWSLNFKGVCTEIITCSK